DLTRHTRLPTAVAPRVWRLTAPRSALRYCLEPIARSHCPAPAPTSRSSARKSHPAHQPPTHAQAFARPTPWHIPGNNSLSNGWNAPYAWNAYRWNASGPSDQTQYDQRDANDAATRDNVDRHRDKSEPRNPVGPETRTRKPGAPNPTATALVRIAATETTANRPAQAASEWPGRANPANYRPRSLE